jgi:penicillin amidase
MKFIGALIWGLLTLALVMLLNKSFGLIPPLGKFLSPYEGFWHNSERSGKKAENLDLNLPGLNDEVKVYIDERAVPHVFAKNDDDLYFMQGYLTARDRLWQMEFISYVAGGRICELVGEKALEMDRMQRRLGLPYGAQQAMELINTDPVAKMALTSYSAGVNTYISSLSYKDLPVEYKLLNYSPEKWTPYKTALLLKFMSKMLAGGDSDFEMTNALNLFGRETLDRLYPDWAGTDPIIPEGTVYGPATVKIDTPSTFAAPGLLKDNYYEKPKEKNIGSNNWAVSGKRTSTGYPILCGDPHLSLYLPSIWYEMQLVAPGVNAYGVTLPGAPCIIIGFNEKIAWSETNAGRDVKDWYKIEYTDASRDSYLYNGQPRKTEKRVEEIKIKGAATYYDTVVYTHYGPVTYDKGFNRNNTEYPLALRWTALDRSNEMRTFYMMNRAKNYADYNAALNYYECPAQNFVFASSEGDIAIRQQGKFPAKWKEQGKFIQNGMDSSHEWQGYIPYDENPHILNPERGFVSSANQHPTDSTYPYYYNGGFEYNRNRRINDVLVADSSITPEDMMKLQLDNFNYTAAEAMPVILKHLESSVTQTAPIYYNDLKKWDYRNDPDSRGAVIFQSIWNELYRLAWDEFLPEDTTGLDAPDDNITIRFLSQYPDDKLLDIKNTPIIENAKILVNMAFQSGIDSLKHWNKKGKGDFNWSNYKATKLGHWARLEGFSVANVNCGGWKHVVNATNAGSGPSWRMIIALGPEPKAWVVYPGGQSGNPGSPHYTDFVNNWAQGKYFEAKFLKALPAGPVQTFKPAGR